VVSGDRMQSIPRQAEFPGDAAAYTISGGSPFTIVSGTDVTVTMVDIPEWQPGGGAQDEGVTGLEYHNKQEAAKY
jgi:hypothetical protein